MVGRLYFTIGCLALLLVIWGYYRWREKRDAAAKALVDKRRQELFRGFANANPAEAGPPPPNREEASDPPPDRKAAHAAMRARKAAKQHSGT
jgi:hypothetical protein